MSAVVVNTDVAVVMSLHITHAILDRAGDAFLLQS
jgi:hypothetical protein